jgi:hypothetical protein
MRDTPGKAIRPLFHAAWISSLILAISVTAPPLSARQNQPAGQDQSAEPGATAPPHAGEPEAEGNPQSVSPTAGFLPPVLTISAGTVVRVRTTNWLSSDQNRPGDSFSATLDQPLVVDGWVAARQGQTVIGRVALAQKASRNNGVSQLGVELTELTSVDGQQLPVVTQLVQGSPERSPAGRNVATVGTTTGLGAVIGAVAGGGEGAAIGAIAGLAAGGILVTRGKPTVIPSESVLTFRLESPLSISTERGQVAFRPVTQADYSTKRDADAYANYPPRRMHGPRYPHSYFDSCYPWGWGCYGPEYFGPYPFFGFGPTFVFRGHFRR